MLAFPLGCQKCSVFTVVFQKAHHSWLHYSQAETTKEIEKASTSRRSFFLQPSRGKGLRESSYLCGRRGWLCLGRGGRVTFALGKQSGEVWVSLSVHSPCPPSAVLACPWVPTKTARFLFLNISLHMAPVPRGAPAADKGLSERTQRGELAAFVQPSKLCQRK